MHPLYVVPSSTLFGALYDVWLVDQAGFPLAREAVYRGCSSVRCLLVLIECQSVDAVHANAIGACPIAHDFLKVSSWSWMKQWLLDDLAIQRTIQGNEIQDSDTSTTI